LGPLDVIEILLLGQAPLPLVRVDRQAVEVIGAARQANCLRFPLGEGAVQVAGNGAPDLRHLQPLVVLRVQQMRRQILSIGALAAKRDHGRRSSSSRMTARITDSSSCARSMAAATCTSSPAPRLAESR